MRAHAFPLLLAAFAAGCTPHPEATSPSDARTREALLLTSREIVHGRHCRIVDPDTPLPNVATIVDTAAVPEYLNQAGITAHDTGYALFSLRFDSAGKPIRARLIEATTPDSDADALRAMIASAVVQREAGAPVAARLRIDLTPAPVYRVGKSEYCDPVRVTANTMAPDPRVTTLPHGPAASRTVTSYKYEAEISATGTVLAIRFDASIDPAFEEPLRESMMKERWEPALDDGAPVAGRGTGSMSIEMRIEGRTVRGP